MILFKKYTANIYLYSLKNDDTHIPNQQLCTIFVHSFFFTNKIKNRTFFKFFPHPPHSLFAGKIKVYGILRLKPQNDVMFTIDCHRANALRNDNNGLPPRAKPSSQ